MTAGSGDAAWSDGRDAATMAAEPLDRPELDTTGAGDAFAAGYLLGGVSLGLAAGARAVATMGGMP